jgi:hydrogenase maturation factor
MCVTRVAKVVSIEGNSAFVKFLDDKETRKIDISMVKVEKNSYVEVFADSALDLLTANEARWRKNLWLEMRRGMTGGPATKH